jgi:hypothetical protein
VISNSDKKNTEYHIALRHSLKSDWTSVANGVSVVAKRPIPRNSCGAGGTSLRRWMSVK